MVVGAVGDVDGIVEDNGRDVTRGVADVIRSTDALGRGALQGFDGEREPGHRRVDFVLYGLGNFLVGVASWGRAQALEVGVGGLGDGRLQWPAQSEPRTRDVTLVLVVIAAACTVVSTMAQSFLKWA